MPVQYFLFDLNINILNKRLTEAYGRAGILDELAKFVADGFDFVQPVDGSNNPWKGFYYKEELTTPEGTDLGYGLPLVFDTLKQAEEILKPILKNDNPEIRRLISTEISPSLSNLAQRGQHWCSGSGRGHKFGSWRDARRLIEADTLSTSGVTGGALTGQNINVFIVDQGVSQAYVESRGGNYGGGMSISTPSVFKAHGEGKAPYTALHKRHGSMMARTILNLAPDAKIFDLPLIPDRIADVTTFVGNAIWAYVVLKAVFLNRSNLGQWVVVNPWGIVSRFGETTRHDYTGNTNNWLNVIISQIALQHDVVFSAGNSGQFCPNPRASGYDVGPGQSIFGANGLEAVNSVGAVRMDGAWVGMSSQGPATYELSDVSNEKPDYAAPSWYVDDADADLRSSGTSASSAVTAGVVAALRQRWGQMTVSPATLKDALRNGAKVVDHPGWSTRTGKGVLNVSGTTSLLP